MSDTLIGILAFIGVIIVIFIFSRKKSGDQSHIYDSRYYEEKEHEIVDGSSNSDNDSDDNGDD